MARLAHISSDEEGDSEVQARSIRATRPVPNRRSPIPSPTPSASFSSDKENRSGAARSAQDTHGKGRVPPPKPRTPNSEEPAHLHSNKRRRLGDKQDASQAVFRQQLAAVEDTRYYDPDQPIEESRIYRKKIRDLSKKLADSRSEYMSADSTGIVETVNAANELYRGVKKTNDATLDSRLLVTTGELSARRSAQMKAGALSSGVDIDEFVGKCMSCLRNGPAASEASSLSASTQRRRQRNDDGSDIEEDEDEEINWEWLGRKLCFPNNVRPALSGFLLGPLSVQKRVRKVTKRQARQRQDPREAVRPDELKLKDIEKVENSNLTTLCKTYFNLLLRTQRDGEARVEMEAPEDATQEEVYELMLKYNLSDDSGVPLFIWAVNPRSFGQTVENLFYTSFLIRDGLVRINEDRNGLPTLHAEVPDSKENSKENKENKMKDRSVQRHQGVFHLDYDVWEDIIATFNIKDCVIPHRQTDEGTQVGTNGWYG